MNQSLVTQTSLPVERDMHDPFAPQHFADSMALARMLATDCVDLLPKSFVDPKTRLGRAGSVYLALNFAHRVGMDPMFVLQNIAIIGNRLSLYGDALWGIVLAHAEDVTESETGSIRDKDLVVTVAIKRHGHSEPKLGVFSYELAKANGYMGKPGQWSSNPARMILWRARHFAARAAFADKLMGISFQEEAQDILDAQTRRPVARPAGPVIEAQPPAASEAQEPPGERGEPSSGGLSEEGRQLMVAIEDASLPTWKAEYAEYIERAKALPPSDQAHLSAAVRAKWIWARTPANHTDERRHDVERAVAEEFVEPPPADDDIPY